MRSKRECTICGSKHKAKGFCVNHYMNYRTTGDPRGKTRRPRSNSVVSFLDLVESIQLDENGCKNWPMGIGSTGYGVFSINNITYSVPRLLYNTLKDGFTADGLVIRHRCDNRSCCNIEHLEIGTQSDNLMDASKRNRLCFAESNNMSRLTKAMVIEIRSLYPKKSTVELGKIYKISPGNIRNAINGKTWKSVPGAKKLITYNRAQGEKMGRSKLTSDQVIEIRLKYPNKNGPQLAKEYGVGHAMIYNIVKGKNWVHI